MLRHALVIALLSATPALAEPGTRALCKAACWPAIERCIVKTAWFERCIRQVRRDCRRDASVCVGRVRSPFPDTLPAVTAQRTPGSVCRDRCGRTVLRCIADGGKPGACRRRTLRQCKRGAVDTVCGPPGELGLFVRSAGTYPAFPDVAVFEVQVLGVDDNRPTAVPASRFTLVDATGAERLAPIAAPVPRPPDCSATDIVPQNGSVICTLHFPRRQNGTIRLDVGGYRAVDDYVL